MGNITYELEDEDEEEDEEFYSYINFGRVDSLREHITNAIGIMNMMQSRPTTQMPVIRKKPDLRMFRHTMMYKEIKALCGIPPTSFRPNERWSLEVSLLKRENGIAGYPRGSFTSNQQRRIANLFIPNKKEKRLMSLEAKVFICKYNNDGSKLITACQDSLVRVFDSSKGTYHRINRIKAKDVNWSILDIDFSPCGEYFAYSTWSDYFFVVPVNGTSEDFQWLDLNSEQSRCGIFSIRFSPCGRTIIGGCNNSCIYMCDRETRTRLNVIRTQRSFQVDINAVSFISEDNSNVFISGCNNGVLKLWDQRCLVRNNRNSPVSVFVGHLDGITYIDPRNDGNHVLSNSKDQSIKIWDLRKPTPQNKTTQNITPIDDWDYRWDTVPREYYNPGLPLEGDASIITYRGHRVTKSLLRAKFSPRNQTGQRYIYTGCGTGRIIIYDVLTGQIKEAIEGHKDIVRDLDWHPIRSEIISSSWDSHVNLNTFKRNPLLKRSSSSDPVHGPLRRSRRIAEQTNSLDDNDDRDPIGDNHRW